MNEDENREKQKKKAKQNLIDVVEDNEQIEGNDEEIGMFIISMFIIGMFIRKH